MALPTKAEKFAELMEHLRKAEECAYTLGHLTIDESSLNAQGWRGVGELFKALQMKITVLATKALH